MTILSPTGLETDTYDMTGWNYIWNKNVDMLNRALLKINALQDVDITNLQHGAMLTWDDANSKWVPRIYGKNLISE